MKEPSQAARNYIDFVGTQLKFHQDAFDQLTRNLGWLPNFLELNPIIFGPVFHVPKLDPFSAGPLADFSKLDVTSFLGPVTHFSKLNSIFVGPLLDVPKVGLASLLAPLMAFPKVNLTSVVGSLAAFPKLDLAFNELMRQIAPAVADAQRANSIFATVAAFNPGTLQAELDREVGEILEDDSDDVDQALQAVAFADMPVDQKLNSLYEMVIDLQGNGFSHKAKKVIGCILLAIVGCFVQSAYKYYLEPHVLEAFEKLNPKEQRKEIKKALIQEKEPKLLVDLRLVRRDTEARGKYKARSELFAVLRRGKIVRLLEKRKKWALVEFEEENEIRQAWVLHKYTEKIL